MKKRWTALTIILIVLLPIGLCYCETFGNTNEEAGTTTIVNRIMFLGAQATGGDGTADYINASIASDGGVNRKIKCALYFDNESLVTNGETEELTITSGSDGWYQFDFEGTQPDIVNGTDYRLAVWGENTGSGTGTVAYAGGGAYPIYADDETYGAWPDPASGSSWGDRAISIFCSYTISAGEERNVFGTINPQSTLSSQKTVSFNRYSTISQVFAIASQKTIAFNLLSSISQIFTLSSSTSFAQNVINVFATIGQLFSIASYRTWSGSITSTIGLVWTVGSTVTATVLRNVFATIGQVFSMASHRTTSFLIDSLINQVFTIQSTVTMPGLVNIHATINAVFQFLSHAAFTAPVEYATKGFVLVTIVLIFLCFAVAVPIIMRRRR